MNAPRAVIIKSARSAIHAPAMREGEETERAREREEVLGMRTRQRERVVDGKKNGRRAASAFALALISKADWQKNVLFWAQVTTLPLVSVSLPPRSVCVCLRCVCFFSLGIAFVFRCANGAKCHRMKFHARLHGNSDSVCHASLPPSPPHMHRRSAPTFSFPHLALIKQRQQWQSEAKRGTSNENASSEILRGTK